MKGKMEIMTKEIEREGQAQLGQRGKAEKKLVLVKKISNPRFETRELLNNQRKKLIQKIQKKMMIKVQKEREKKKTRKRNININTTNITNTIIKANTNPLDGNPINLNHDCSAPN